MPHYANCDQTLCTTSHMKCSSCSKPVHSTCIGIQGEDAMRLTRLKCKNVKVLCNPCNSTDDKFQQLKNSLRGLVETKFAQLEEKISIVNTTLSSETYEDIVGEAVERINRFHIIIPSVPETNSPETYKLKVEEILSHLQGDSIKLHPRPELEDQFPIEHG
ncbi:hypothetical protein JTB14_024215 [Gonioctena quinquepunctata]|nr:hypothetical protein JTB14_024215 [Gonioctena quinquepunctata]